MGCMCFILRVSVCVYQCAHVQACLYVYTQAFVMGCAHTAPYVEAREEPHAFVLAFSLETVILFHSLLLKPD